MLWEMAARLLDNPSQLNMDGGTRRTFQLVVPGRLGEQVLDR